ncbi:MAG: glycoside hydrolase family 9 protein [Ruminococcus sp.]
MKKWIAAISAAVLAFTGTAAAVPTVMVTAEPNSEYNYGEALQKSMFFYEVQQCGELPEWNEVTWRADAMTNDYVPGGWFDAGDHLKFTLTNAYAATMLGWGLLEYSDGVEKCGQTEMYENNLQFALDYLVGCDLGDEIVYMIGEGSFDHVWWGAAEMYMAKYELQTGNTVRPYYTCNDSCIEAQMAAALCTGYLNFKDSQPEKAAEYLEHAKALFDRADKNRSIGDDTEEQAYYKISTFYDDLFFAANWLYMATGDQKYLDLCESDYISQLGREQQSSELKFTWGHCWDDTQQGGTLLYAINTGDATWKDQFKKHLEYWTTGYNGARITYTPDGLPWLFQWGSLRHATTTAFLAYVAVDELYADDASLVTKYTDFADSVMNYCFGDNSANFSYVVGMGEDYPKAWHHRTSSGAWNDKWSGIGQTEGEDAKEHAHILYGALVGGPDQNDGYSDKIGDYQYTEVAIDYNAGYTAALCAMVEKYGGTSDPDFPPTETPKWDEFSISASINQSASSYTELKVFALNHTAWPARVIKDLSYNYYFDITELVEAGYSIDDVSVKIGYDQHASDKGAMSISDPIQYDGNIYYVKLSFADGSVVMPTGQSEHRSECQFRISIPDNIQGVWDPTNDYSYEGLTQGGEDAMVITDKITMYDGDTLIWGVEPDGTTPEVTTPTTKPAQTTTTTETTTTASSVSETTDSDIYTTETTTEGTTVIYDADFRLGLEIASLPDKLTYTSSDTELDLAGLTLNTYFIEENGEEVNTGNSITIDDIKEPYSIEVSGFDPSATGTQTITLTYSTYNDILSKNVFATASFDITVGDGESTTADSSTTTTTTTASSGSVSGVTLYGDVNLDGRVDITDAVLLNKASAGSVSLNDQAAANADCNANGELGSDDAIALLKFLVHLISSLPTE